MRAPRLPESRLAPVSLTFDSAVEGVCQERTGWRR